VIGRPPLRKFNTTELGVQWISGPFSKYLNWRETAILLALVKSVRPRVMIEFGCNEGITAKRLLQNLPELQRYIGVDLPADHEPTLACQYKEQPVNPGYVAASDPRFFYLESRTQMLRDDQLEPCDAVFIDGDHSEAAVLHESRMARRLLRRPGIIVWHDWTNPNVQVTQALTQLTHEGWPIDCVDNSWLAFMKVEGHAAHADETAQG
jgi:predicted O-methyltransferase YrrM